MKGKSTLSAPTKTAVVKRKIQKKSYSLPGQKFDVPEEVCLCFPSYSWFSFYLVCNLFVLGLCQREPLRIFYETLSKQIPTSEMADFWWVFRFLVMLIVFNLICQFLSVFSVQFLCFLSCINYLNFSYAFSTSLASYDYYKTAYDLL